MTGNSTIVDFHHNLMERAEGVTKSEICLDSVDNNEPQVAHATPQSQFSAADFL